LLSLPASIDSCSLSSQEAFTSSFTVLDDGSMEFLLGLDMLRKHQACINLRDNVLAIRGEASF